MAYPMHDRDRRRCPGEPGPARGRAAGARATGPPTRPSRPASRPRAGRRRRRQRVRLLRRPAVRQRPAALRPPAHRLRQGRGAALPDHARPPGRAPVRLGLPRPARRGGGREAARHHHQGRDPRRWAWPSSTRPAATSVLRYTQDWERYVTRQARWVDFDNDYKTLDLAYMESVMWAFKTLYDKGLVYEGFRVLAYCWRCETPLSNTETRMDDVYRDRQDPALTVWFELPDEPASRERSLVWTTTPWTLPSNLALAVGPDIEYAVLEQRRRAATSSARPGSAAYAKELDGRDAGRHGDGRELVGRRYTPLFDFLVEQAGPNAFQVLGGRLRHHRGRHRRGAMAPAFGEDDQNVCNAAGIPTVRHRGRPHPVHRAGARRTQGQQVFEANKPVIRELQGAGRGAAAGHLHPLVPALLALRHPAGLQGGVVVVRRGDPVPGPDGRAEPADHLGARARQGRLVRQVAGQRPGLVDQPEPVLGLADPGVEVRRPALPARRRLRLARRARARLRRAPDRPAPAVRRRADPAQPGRPDRAVDDAPGAGGAGLLVRVRLDAVRPGALPVRERATGSSTTTRATSSSSTSGRPAAGSTRCTCWPPRCSTGRRSATA